MTGEHGQRRSPGVVRDPQVGWVDDEGVGHPMHDFESGTVGNKDEVPIVESVEIAKRPGLGRTMSGKYDIAVFARPRRAGLMRNAPVDHRHRDARPYRLVEADRRNPKRSKVMAG